MEDELQKPEEEIQEPQNQTEETAPETVAEDVSAELDDMLGLDDEEDDNEEVSTDSAVATTEENVPVKEEEEEKPAEPIGPITKWYSLRVISGKERKIKERIELEIQRNNWGEFVRSIIVPTEKVYKIRNGKKMISERNILPGYMMVEATPDNFTGEMITAIANTPNVIHFLGKTKPIPMRDAEAHRLLGKVDENSEMGEQMVEPFIVGETVKIIDGPFSEFVGDVLEVNEDKKKMKVMVKIFGRGTEVELNYTQVDKQ
ncbi:MAG: transcriptional antiterminator NusG [Saprospiraceae bacterium]|jgi:transcriptional antiterminator NusG